MDTHEKFVYHAKLSYALQDLYYGVNVRKNLKFKLQLKSPNFLSNWLWEINWRGREWYGSLDKRLMSKILITRFNAILFNLLKVSNQEI